MRRRAKYLVADIEGGDALIMHLGMSGRFTIAPAPGTADTKVGAFEHGTGLGLPHDHVVFHMSGGATVTYNDPRRFGFMDLARSDEIDAHKLFAGLGPEPFSHTFNARYLAERAVGRAVDLKAFLLDQRIVAGLGNIYVAEVLFRAGVSPKRLASTLADRDGQPTERTERVVTEVRNVLADAIAAGGSTLRDYQHTDGSLGYFQHSFQVYGREGEPCMSPGCAGTIKRIVHSARSTFYCARCQR